METSYRKALAPQGIRGTPLTHGLLNRPLTIRDPPARLLQDCGRGGPRRCSRMENHRLPRICGSLAAAANTLDLSIERDVFRIAFLGRGRRAASPWLMMRGQRRLAGQARI
jgi:hypothetical protein